MDVSGETNSFRLIVAFPKRLFDTFNTLNYVRVVRCLMKNATAWQGGQLLYHGLSMN